MSKFTVKHEIGAFTKIREGAFEGNTPGSVLIETETQSLIVRVNDSGALIIRDLEQRPLTIQPNDGCSIRVGK